MCVNSASTILGVAGDNGCLASGGSSLLDQSYSSSTMYSIVQSANENNLNPYWYMRYLFAMLPFVELEADLRKLLPTEVTVDQLTEYCSKCH